MKSDVFSGHVELLDEKEIYKGFLTVKELTLRHSLFKGGWSPALKREVVHSSRVVAVLMFDPVADKVLLVEQFRPGVFSAGEPGWVLEVVAGRVDKNESLEDAAKRETLEETGCCVNELLLIADFFSSTSGCDEKVKLYCGLFESKDSDSMLCGVACEAEDICTHLYSTRSLIEELDAGNINNATSVIALQWLKLNHSRLVSEHTKN